MFLMTRTLRNINDDVQQDKLNKFWTSLLKVNKADLISENIEEERNLEKI